MSRTGYQALGFVVWRATKWFARRRLDRMPASKKVAAASVVGAAVAALVLAGRHADGESS